MAEPCEQRRRNLAHSNIRLTNLKQIEFADVHCPSSQLNLPTRCDRLTTNDPHLVPGPIPLFCNWDFLSGQFQVQWETE
jgi:hypothetical protein